MPAWTKEVTKVRPFLSLAGCMARMSSGFGLCSDPQLNEICWSTLVKTFFSRRSAFGPSQNLHQFDPRLLRLLALALQYSCGVGPGCSNAWSKAGRNDQILWSAEELMQLSIMLFQDQVLPELVMLVLSVKLVHAVMQRSWNFRNGLMRGLKFCQRLSHRLLLLRTWVSWRNRP